MLDVEAAQEPDRSVATRRHVMERFEEELVELAIEQRRIGERRAKDKWLAADTSLTGQPWTNSTSGPLPTRR